MDILALKNKALVSIENCNNPDELKELVVELDTVCKLPWLDKDNFSYFESMICKLQIKRYLIMYYESGYSQAIYDRLIDCYQAIENLAKRREYEGTYVYAHNYHFLIEKIHPLIVDIFAISNSMQDSFGNRMMKSETDYLLIIENLNNRIKVIDSLEKIELFPSSVKVESPIDVSRKVITKLIDDCNNIMKAIKEERETLFLKHHTKNIKEVEKIVYEFYPDLRIEENKYSNAIILCSPLIEEIRLYVNAYMHERKLDCVIINSSSLENMDEIIIRETFELLKNKNLNLLIEGLEKFTNAKTLDYLLQAIMTYAKNGMKIFIVDSIGDNELYKQFVTICKKEDNTLTIMDISSTYLSMPSFQNFIQLLVDEKIIPNSSGEYTKEIKEKLPFMGFRGLNEIFIAVSSGTDWMKKAEQISKKNKNSKVEDYLKKIPSQSLFIDTFWGDFTQGVIHIENDKPKFDYDGVRLVNPNNIKKIVESSLTLFEKCGLVTRYCLLAGDDVSIWPTLNKETQQSRLQEATSIVYQLLGIFEFVPVVNIVELIDNDPCILGQCQFAGKVILYQHKGAQNIDSVVETVCHESFHAFQFLAINSPYNRWFWNELGISLGRIEQWRLNNSSYFSTSKGDKYEHYRYQIFESDAFAFQQDCIESSGKVINLVDFE